MGNTTTSVSKKGSGDSAESSSRNGAPQIGLYTKFIAVTGFQNCDVYSEGIFGKGEGGIRRKMEEKSHRTFPFQNAMKGAHYLFIFCRIRQV
jgi:hypothetical protein